MITLRQSTRASLLDPETFFWCTGIEDTFITDPWPSTGRTLDEYELTQHYTRWREDIELMRRLQVPAARYGIPWHRINPGRGVWDWDFAERAIDRMLEVGIQPIVDLVHYGLPRWMEGAYLNADFPEYMAEYAGQVAQRFRGRVFAYTPLNEPRITAWYCGRIGWWPPYEKSSRGFLSVMKAVCRGIVRTVETIQSIDPEILPVPVDATDIYTTTDSNLQAEVELRQDIVFLALDLICGKVQGGHRLQTWALENGCSETELGWFAQHALEIPLLGINLYPMFTQKLLQRDRGGRLRVKMLYADGKLIDRLAEMYWSRYHVPLFISETASVGSVARRMAWLDQSIKATKRVRESGIPLVGYTWWPLFALVTWAYRQGNHEPAYYLKQMGLWNLDTQFERVATPLLAKWHQFVAATGESIGRVAESRQPLSA